MHTVHSCLSAAATKKKKKKKNEEQPNIQFPFCSPSRIPNFSFAFLTHFNSMPFPKSGMCVSYWWDFIFLSLSLSLFIFSFSLKLPSLYLPCCHHLELETSIKFHASCWVAFTHSIQVITVVCVIISSLMGLNSLLFPCKV